MITYFKFKDMIDIAYHSNNDCLYLSLSDDYLQNNSPFKNSKDYMLEYEKRTTDNNVPLIILMTQKIILLVLFLNCLMIANLAITLVAILSILSVNSIRKLVLMITTGIAF